MRSLFVLALVVAACGSKNLPPPNLPPFPEESAEAPRPPPGVLWRQDVDQALEAGLGNFLQLVAVEPYLQGGQFVGWEVVDLRPQEFWADVDLQLGDVVTAINGMPIERDSEAFAAFESLAKAKELRVAMLRQGRGRELSFRIEPMPPGGASAPAQKTQKAGSPPASESKPASTKPADTKPAGAKATESKGSEPGKR